MPSTAQRITEFLDWLRDTSFDAADQQYLAAQDLLERVAGSGRWPQREAEWRTLLAPVVCSSSAQQRQFYDLFRSWFGSTLEDPRVDQGTESGFSAPRSWLARKRVYLRAGLAVALVALVAGWKGDTRMPPSPAVTAQGRYTLPELGLVPAAATLFVQDSSGRPIPKAKAYFGGQVVEADENGRALLNYSFETQGKYLLVTGQGVRPVLQERPTGDTVIRLQIAQDDPAAFTGVGQKRKALRFCSVVVPVAAFLVWIVLLLRRELEIRKWTTPVEPRMRQLGLSVNNGLLFRGSDIRKLATALRRRRTEQLADLNPELTAEATARNAGYFSPVAAERSAEPEYLFLGERKNLRDHQCRLHDELILRLRDHDVAVDRYYFQSDPRVSTDLKGNVYSPSELCALHANHEIWLAVDSSRCIDPVQGVPVSWWSSLCQWRDRVLLSWRDPSSDLDIRLAKPSRQGLEALALGSEIANHQRPPYPSLLAAQPERWLDRSTPPPAAVSRLGAQLVRFLEAHGYLLLQACAVYPAIAWNITTTLARELLPSAEVESSLERISELPWFRHGMMPDWLRLRLVRGLGPNESLVRDALRKYLDTANQAVGRKEALDLVPSRRRAGRHDGPIRDEILLYFARRKKLDQLSLQAPKGWRRFLLESIWLRFGGALLVMLGLVAGALYTLDSVIDQSAKKEGLHTIADRRPSGAFVNRMLDVAEAIGPHDEQSPADDHPLKPRNGLENAQEYSSLASDVQGVEDPLSSLPHPAQSKGYSPDVGDLVFTDGDGGLVQAFNNDQVWVFNVPTPMPLRSIVGIANLNNLQLFKPPSPITRRPEVKRKKQKGRQPDVVQPKTPSDFSKAPAVPETPASTPPRTDQPSTPSTPSPDTQALRPIVSVTAAEQKIAPTVPVKPTVCETQTMHERKFQRLKLPGSGEPVFIGLSNLYRIDRGPGSSQLFLIKAETSDPAKTPPELTFSFSTEKKFPAFSYRARNYSLTIDKLNHRCFGNGCQTATFTICEAP